MTIKAYPLNPSLGYLLRNGIDTENYSIHLFMDAMAKSEKGGKLRIIDVGCGAMPYRELFSRNCEIYAGVDFRTGEKDSNPNIVADTSLLPAADNTFDVAICSQVLEHVREPLAQLKEICRVLKPGGRLYLTAPQGWEEHQKPHDFYRFTSFALRDLFECAGFNIVSIEPRGGYFWFMSHRIRAMAIHLMPKSNSFPARALRPILAFIARRLFLVFFPWLFFKMDYLDTRKDLTLGYSCHVVKKNETDVNDNGK